jgi:hypothetical protein
MTFSKASMVNAIEPGCIRLQGRISEAGFGVPQLVSTVATSRIDAPDYMARRSRAGWPGFGLRRRIAILLLPVAMAMTTVSSMPLRAADSKSAQMDERAMENTVPGLHDFDFLLGRWRVHHRRLKDRVAGSHEWVEFDGTSFSHQVLGGQRNVDDNVLDVPGDPYRAVTLRAFDPKSRQWSIWWLDSRTPSGSLEPAVRGGFKDGVGEFYADDTLKGRAVRVRFIWSHITCDIGSLVIRRRSSLIPPGELGNATPLSLGHLIKEPLHQNAVPVRGGESARRDGNVD